MEVIYECVCGLDVHSASVQACVRRLKAGRVEQEVRSFGTMTRDILALSDWLASEGVTHVAMESTGVYWKPIYNIFEGRFEVLLVNAKHVKHVPGRKTDVKDCQWLAQLPGFDQRSAQNVVAEIGKDMSRFPTDDHLAAWAGICPGSNESGGKRKSGKTTKGSRWLRTALVQAAWAASHAKNSYFRAQLRRLAGRRGNKRALVAVAHSLLVVIYHILKTGRPFCDLGVNYFDKLDSQRIVKSHVRRLESLGYKVTLVATQEAA
jgi:transposase